MTGPPLATLPWKVPPARTAEPPFRTFTPVTLSLVVSTSTPPLETVIPDAVPPGRDQFLATIADLRIDGGAAIDRLERAVGNLRVDRLRPVEQALRAAVGQERRARRAAGQRLQPADEDGADDGAAVIDALAAALGHCCQLGHPAVVDKHEGVEPDVRVAGEPALFDRQGSGIDVRADDLAPLMTCTSPPWTTIPLAVDQLTL